MAYINFKEERSAALDQLQKRINNNKAIFNKVRENKKIHKFYLFVLVSLYLNMP